MCVCVCVCVCVRGEERKSFKGAGSGVVIGSITMAREGKWFTKRQGPGGGALKGESCGVARQPGDREDSSDAG